LTGFWFQHQIGVAIFLGILLLIAMSNLRALHRLSDYPPTRCTPLVSVLIPARDEAETIGPCLRSLLAQDYADFEVLVLDDGSTDGTGTVLAELEAQDDRPRVFQGQPLPEGWLGKHWACWQLAEAANGDLILFTDADTHHDPGMLRAAVAALEAEEADLLTAFLRQEVVSWGERLTVPVLFWSVFSFLPIGLAHRLRLPALSLTNGQFMLFRRAAYQAIGGHAAVRANPVDDIALGWRVKAAGLRWRMVYAVEFVRCRMYRSLHQALEGLSKNLFAAFGFRLLEYLFVWLWVGLITWEPLIVLILSGIGVPLPRLALWPAALAVAEMLALWIIAMSHLRFQCYLALLYPLSVLLFLFVAFRSLACTVTGRATWKGRSLPRQQLRLM
jgi:chlorobactene glucosyltransferase